MTLEIKENIAVDGNDEKKKSQIYLPQAITATEI